MPKRGLSADEKKDKMLDFFHEHQDFFTMKDLERLCSKEKGIVAQSVKDICMQLVSDGLVDSEKIGTSTYFWSFPSKLDQKLKRDVEDLKVQLAEAEKKEQMLLSGITEAKKGREDGDDRQALLDALETTKKELEKVQQELATYRENDPTVFEQMKTDVTQAVDAANRWTDNIFALKKWLGNKFGLDEATLNKQFGIPDEIDYL